MAFRSKRHGRAALSNPSGRFEPHTTEAIDDGWDIEEERAVLRTEVTDERPRRIITRNTSPDLSFDRSINPYRGCEHGCFYCFARPSHEWLGLSLGLDFETRLIARPLAPDVLEEELRAKSYRPRVIAIGTNTDPYQPIERDRGIMRRILEVLLRYNHPVAIVTKGTLIERDLDVLGALGRRGLVRVGISVTTLDPSMARKMEPRVPAPERRIRTIRYLTEAGCPVRVMASPMIPGLTDHELEAILAAAQAAGAVAASWSMLRLPHGVAQLFRDWLVEHFPDRAARVMGRVRDVHGGKDYDPEWGKRMTGEGLFAELMKQRFNVSCGRLGLDQAVPALRTDLFKCPAHAGDQLDLFD